jgi:hypothetical protein
MGNQRYGLSSKTVLLSRLAHTEELKGFLRHFAPLRHDLYRQAHRLPGF